jgi:3-oxoacyl-[acyl-carrier-protein] synthase II
MSGRRKVVVTGLGMVTPLGITVEENWEKALKGESGIKRITIPGSASSPVTAAGEVSQRDLDTIRRLFERESSSEGEKRTLFALWSTESALNDAGLLGDEAERAQCGVILAAGLGINMIEDVRRWTGRDGGFDYKKFAGEYREVHRESGIRNVSSRPSELIADRYGLSGYNGTVTSACAAATQSIGLGYRMIQRGDADIVLAGGSDSMINPIGVITFVLLKAAAVSSDDPGGICRPFDRKRAGLVMGEGAGIVVLEEEERALERGAKIYAEVAGYGSSMDAYQVTAPHPEGRGAETSMGSALRDAAMDPREVDYINAHGTGTKLNDVAETLAIRRVFGEHAQKVAVSSSKSMIGHLIAAAGGPEFIYTVLSVHRNEIHPTINLSTPDPRCDLDYVPNTGRAATVNAAISNSFGFGGQNATVVVKKYSNA